jgi:hypothetical protein
MESKFYRVLIISNAVGVAAYSAVALGYVPLYYFGFPSEQVRGGAMLAAISIAALVAVDFFGKKLRKAK